VPFLPEFLKKFRACFCCFPFLCVAILLGFLLYRGNFKSFYTIALPTTPSLPSIGDIVQDKNFSVQVTHVEKIKSTANPSSDFETVHLQVLVTTSQKIPAALFVLFDFWIEDQFGNKFTISPTEPKNQLLQNSEVMPGTQLNFDAYFTTPRYAQTLYLVVQPKLGGSPLKVKL